MASEKSPEVKVVSRVHIDRHTLSQNELDNLLDRRYDQTMDIKQEARKTKAKCKSSSWWKSVLLGKLPVINLIRTYQFRQWILWDILAGINVGMVHIPQSMGFSLLAQLPPVYGLYTTIFQIPIYFLFGTSRHISVGTMAVPCILMGTVVNSQVEVRRALAMAAGRGTETTTTMTVAGMVTGSGGGDFGNGTDEGFMFDEEAERIDIAASVTLIAGLFQVRELKKNIQLFIICLPIFSLFSIIL